MPGTLVEIKVKPGDKVTKGQELARLTNDQLKLDINRLDRKVAEKRAELQSLLKERSYSGSKAHNEIGAVRQQLGGAEKELDLKIADLDRLILRAPTDGTVIAPPAQPDRSGEDDEVLASWSGTPLESKNQYTLLTRGTLFCQIGEPSKLEGVLAKEMDAKRIDSSKFKAEKRLIKLHGHCQQKAVASMVPTKKMLSLPKGYEVQLIPSGCCGMAGSFGYEKEHYDISMKIGELVLFPTVRQQPEEVLIAAPGTSCRHQIHDGTGKHSKHPIEILWEALI